MGSIMVIKYLGGMKEKEPEWFMPCGERQIKRGVGSEEWTEVGGLLATQGHGDIQA